MTIGGLHRLILDLCNYRASNVNPVGLTFHNVVHRHFPWFKEKTGDRDSSMSLQYAVPQIGTTESEGEPIMCGIDP